MASYMELIQKILRMFVPGKFVLTVFANEVNSKTTGVDLNFWLVALDKYES